MNNSCSFVSAVRRGGPRHILCSFLERLAEEEMQLELFHASQEEYRFIYLFFLAKRHNMRCNFEGFRLSPLLFKDLQTPRKNTLHLKCLLRCSLKINATFYMSGGRIRQSTNVISICHFPPKQTCLKRCCVTHRAISNQGSVPALKSRLIFPFVLWALQIRWSANHDHGLILIGKKKSQFQPGSLPEPPQATAGEAVINGH